MRTDIMLQLADSIQGDVYFEMSAGQNEHGMLGHLIALYPELRNRYMYPNFKQGVCSTFGIGEMDYKEIFYPKVHDANWRASTQKFEPGHITSKAAASFLRTLASLWKEASYEVGRTIPDLRFFPVTTVNVKDGLTLAHYRALWSFSRYRRSINSALMYNVRSRYRKDLDAMYNKGAETPLNLKRSHGYFGEYPNVPLAISEYFLAELDWPETESTTSKIVAVSTELKLPVWELRRIFAPRYDDEGYVASARKGGIGYISPLHGAALLKFLDDTGHVSWRMAKKIEDESNSEDL